MTKPNIQTAMSPLARRRYSFWLVVLWAVLPTIAFGIFVAAKVIADTRAHLAERYEQVAHALLSASDTELTAQTRAVQGLAALDTGDPAEFIRQAGRVVDARGDWYNVNLVGPGGNVLASTTGAVSADDPPTVSQSELVDRIFQTGMPVIGRIVVKGYGIDAPHIPIRVPVFRDGRVAFVLSVNIKPSAINAIIRSQTPGPESLLTVYDADLHIVAQSGRDDLAGHVATESVRRQVESGEHGIFLNLTLDGGRYLRVLERSPATGWHAAVGITEAAFEQQLRRTSLLLAIGAAVLVLAGLAGTVMAGRRFGAELVADQHGIMRSSERQLQLSIESAPAAIAMFDRNMRYLAVSRRYAEDYGIELTSLVGHSHYDIFPEISERWRDIHQRCLGGALEGCAEDQFSRLDGSVDWVSWEISPWYESTGAVGGLVLCSEHITWRKKIETALKESENKFHSLANAMPQLAWIAQADGYIYWYNNRWYEYTGTTAPQMEGWGWKRVHDPEILPTVMERWLASIATGQPFDMTFPLRGADGQFRPFLTRVMPLLGQDGRVLQWFGTNTEISEQKAMEDALRHAIAEAERANEAKSHFLAAASHDLRQPFQALRLYIDFLAQQLHEPKHLKAAQMAGIALGSGENLLNALLNVAKLEAGTVEIQRRPVAFMEIVAELAAQCDGPAREKGLTLSFVASSAVIDSDPVLLARLLRNLLENAIKYTERGRVLVGCRRSKDGVRIEIWDSGIGIAPEQQQRIFDDFYQIGNASRDQQKGLGIGLGVVRRTAQLLGCEVTVRSWPDRGSVFALTIRRSPEQPRRDDVIPRISSA